MSLGDLQATLTNFDDGTLTLTATVPAGAALGARLLAVTSAMGRAERFPAVDVVGPILGGIQPARFEQQQQDRVQQAVVGGLGLAGATVAFASDVSATVVDASSETALSISIDIPGLPQPPLNVGGEFIVWVAVHETVEVAYSVTTPEGIQLGGSITSVRLDWKEKGT